MKRSIIILVVAAMVIAVFSACGGIRSGVYDSAGTSAADTNAEGPNAEGTNAADASTADASAADTNIEDANAADTSAVKKIDEQRADKPFAEITPSVIDKSILVLTEDDAQKKSIVEDIIKMMKLYGMEDIRVATEDFDAIDESDFDAIVVMWHAIDSSMTSEAAKFLSGVDDQSKIIYLEEEGAAKIVSDIGQRLSLFFPKQC